MDVVEIGVVGILLVGVVIMGAVGIVSMDVVVVGDSSRYVVLEVVV